MGWEVRIWIPNRQRPMDHRHQSRVQVLVLELELEQVLVFGLEQSYPTHLNLHCLQKLELVVAPVVLVQLELVMALPSRRWMNCLRKQVLVPVVLVSPQTELAKQPVLKESVFPIHWSCRALVPERVEM